MKAARPRLGVSATTVRILALALGVRLASAGIAYLADVSFRPYLPTGEPRLFGNHADAFWDPFVRWDSGWYFGIARTGYKAVPDHRSNIAFFPVYPLAMRGLVRLMHGRYADFYRAGIFISWTSFGAALLILHRLARMDLDEPAAWRAILYVALFPFAFFFGVVYGEGLFLLLTVASFYCFRTGRFTLGGLAGALASATRVNGIFALPALAVVGLPAARSMPRGLLRLGVGLVLVAAGLGIYCVFIWQLTGNPFEWAATIERWNYAPGGAPWSAIVNVIEKIHADPSDYLAFDANAPYEMLNGAAGLLAVLAIPFVATRFGLGYALLMLVNLWVPLSSGLTEGLGRYCAVLFPLALWLGQGEVRLHRGLLATFVVFYVLALSLFTAGYPLY